MNEVELIKDQLEKAFYGGAWHGPSVLEALENINAGAAFSKPVNGAHSIWEIVLHLTTWQDYIRRRILGEQYYPSPEDDWPEVNDKSQAAWESSISNLKAGMKDILEVLPGLKPDKLNDEIPGKNCTYYTALHGLIQHDIYHAGQIVLLKKH